MRTMMDIDDNDNINGADDDDCDSNNFFKVSAYIKNISNFPSSH